MRPICVPCMAFMKPLKNGVIVQAGDYYLYAADLYGCPECSTEMITGFSQHPVAELYEREKFTSMLQYSLGKVPA